MRKVLLFILLISAFIGCKSKEDKVMEGLDKLLVKSPTKEVAQFCTDVYQVYKIPETQKCGTDVAIILSKGRADFKAQSLGNIENRSIKESINILKLKYILDDRRLGLIISEGTLRYISDKVIYNDEIDDLSRYKVLNLTYLLALDLNYGGNRYTLQSEEIVKNDSVDWQKAKSHESTQIKPK